MSDSFLPLSSPSLMFSPSHRRLSLSFRSSFLYCFMLFSLISSDENVVVGSAPATAGKSSITDYGTLEGLGEKLASKRAGTLVKADARTTDGTVFYSVLINTHTQ